MKKLILLFVFICSGLVIANQGAFYTKSVVLNIKNTKVQSFLTLIARQSGFQLKADPDISGEISYSFGSITPNRALNKVATDLGLEYKLSGNTLIVKKASSDESISDISTPDGKNKFGHLKLKYINAIDVPAKVQTLLKPGEKIIVDEVTNSIGIFASKKSSNLIKAYLKTIDIAPIQILIEAQIVEISKNKIRELGITFNAGGNTNAILNNNNFAVASNNSISSAPGNLAASIKLGQIASDVLQMKLAAAETKGAAKIISRPKVITLNNISANILSGRTYHVKILSTTTTADGGTVAGGIQAINAGLSLNVTPTAVGDMEIKLKISVSNSEADLGSAVDGIPGIVENSANTTIIVKSGETATMAGLIKKTISKNDNGVPGLKDIPFFGWLFKSQKDTVNDTEMIIFITPRILKHGASITKLK